MNSPVDTIVPQVPLHKNHKERRALLFVIIIIALAVLGFVMYQYFKKPAVVLVVPLTDAEKAEMLATVSAESQIISASIPPAEKAKMLADVSTESKKVSASLTEAQKAAMLAEVVAQSQQ